MTNPVVTILGGSILPFMAAVLSQSGGGEKRMVMFSGQVIVAKNVKASIPRKIGQK
jgi:hypothetical protein